MLQYVLNTIVSCLFVCMQKYNWCNGWRIHLECSLDCGFEPRSGQKDYKISICFFNAKYTAFRSKIKHWLAWNRDNVSERRTCQFSELAKSDSACWSSTKRTSLSSHWKKKLFNNTHSVIRL